MESTRQKIIEVAQELIQQSGKVDVRLTEIADRLGITHGALYRHFKNKQELWIAVAKHWFDSEIIQQIKVAETINKPHLILHDWLWQFVNAKKRAYNEEPGMFTLNATYIENDPEILRSVLLDSMKWIDQLMGYNQPHYEKAEAILATFAVFTLPSFKTTWNAPDYQARFEQIWNLIKLGL
ncbi:TetR/AcrR family transcriptional regulator [Loigolactobacillus zhaoyuanensis]|uniref:TetR/AcrR family transcriptional regulator n=1 Tax=Loigolactobacillus zhaoyuanensis TaxID=2486017 RepID=UPI000F73E88A|nr:TetR/AcrR family transcriptional regulator [Loigolactobacillus zhaoyuanensis]